MMTVHEVSGRTGVSVRALHHYDRIGLLRPAAVTEAGWRLYDGESLARLQRILLYRELEFPLEEIRQLLDDPSADPETLLEQQLQLLLLRRERLDRLIALARKMKETGGRTMDFDAFDTKKLDAYKKQAKESWGASAEYREYEKKSAGRTDAQERDLGARLMALLKEFGRLKALPPDAPEARSQARRLQAFISEHYYACSDAMLRQLGALYTAGGEMTESIDAAGGPGTAEYAGRVIAALTEKQG